MVFCGDRNLTAHGWLSIGHNAHDPLDTLHAVGLDAISKQFGVKWFVREQFIQ